MKLSKSKVFIGVVFLTIVVILIGGSLIMVRDVDLKDTPQDTEVNKEDNNENIEINEYQVIFNSNGGSLVSPVTVKEGEVLTKPEDPTRDGYKFLNWTLDDKEYDFENLVTSNLVLKANWEKKKTSSTTTTTTTKPSNNKKVESTLDKINLNDNIITFINHEHYTQPIFYYYITNLGEVFPNLKGKTSIVIGFNDEEYESYDLTLNEFYGNFDKFKFDTAKENTAKDNLKKIANKKYKGVLFENVIGTDYSDKEENINVSEKHGINYKYEYITTPNGTLKTLYNDIQNNIDNLNKELSNNFSGAIMVTLPGYGVYGRDNGGLMTEEMCQKYNFVCDRW